MCLASGDANAVMKTKVLSLAASGGLGRTRFNTFKLNAVYSFDQTYGVTFGYNLVISSCKSYVYLDLVYYKPDSEYFTAGLLYVPFGKAKSANA